MNLYAKNPNSGISLQNTKDGQTNTSLCVMVTTNTTGTAVKDVSNVNDAKKNHHCWRWRHCMAITAFVVSVVVVYNVMIRVDDVSTFVLSSLRGHYNHRIHVDNINIINNNNSSDVNDHNSKDYQGIVY